MNVGHTLSGEEFNKLQLFCYKLLPYDFKCVGVLYNREGLYTEDEGFTLTLWHTNTDLYFCSKEQLADFADVILSAYYICEVKIPPDATVHAKRNKYTTDKYILGKPRVFYLDEYVEYPDVLRAVKNHRHALQRVKKQNEELCLAAVKNDMWAFEYVHTLTKNICLTTIKYHARRIHLITISKRHRAEIQTILNEGDSPIEWRNLTENERFCIEAGFLLEKNRFLELL